eukprot:SAG22_NODE_1962_length_3242_cov_2.053452_2_plen_442_part_00
MTGILNHADVGGSLRFSADVGCNTRAWTAGDGIDNGCEILAKSSVNKLMNMRTYNAPDYTTWARSALSPALAQIPLSKLGAGLGCWVDSRTKGTWNLKPESATDRVCLLMNQSIPEIDMFILKPIGSPIPFPEPFWIPALERYVAGGGCEAKVPAPLPTCPNASVGAKNTTWEPGGDSGCCISSSRRPVKTGLPPTRCDISCAKAECAAAGMIWKPENYSTHPYECCHTAALEATETARWKDDEEMRGDNSDRTRLKTTDSMARRPMISTRLKRDDEQQQVASGITLSKDGFFLRSGSFFYPIGVNYWPSSSGCNLWTAETFPKEEIQHDLDVLAASPFNSLRVFIEWGALEPIAGNFDEKKFENFAMMLGWIKQRGLLVDVSTFVGWMSGRHYWPSWKNGRNLYTDVTMINRSVAFAAKVAKTAAPFASHLLAMEYGNEM